MLKNLGSIGGVPNIIIENLVYRFVEKLDFGDVKVKVAGDAVRLVQRMKKDWMAIGRRPAGVCGASVILAARMNNFRRSVREVVYIAKVTDLTIHKRLDEFKVTASSDLTIDQFRVMELEREHDPPAFYEDRRKNKRRKLSTQAAGETEEGEGTEGGSNVGSRASSAAPQEQPRGRIDQDGFAIPDQPSHNPLIDPELLAASNDALSEISDTASVTSQSPPKRKRGRPRKDSAAAQLPALSRKDIEDQEALEREITEMVNDPTAKRHAANATSAGNDNSQASNLTSSTSNAINSTPSTINSSTSIHNEEAYARSLAIATQVSSQHKPVSAIPDTEIIPEDEFAGDLDVENCLLTEPEREIKERIWVHENQDYLRTQQARLLKKQMEEKNGSSRVIRRRRRVHKGQIGAEGEHTSGASTPQEAARMMLTRRGFSTRINYANIERMISKERKTKFRRGSAASGENASDLGSEVATEAGSEAASPPAALSPDDDGGEEEEAEGLESAVGEAINDAVDAAEDGLFLR
jgi:transcription factor IIIB subunit 2